MEYLFGHIGEITIHVLKENTLCLSWCYAYILILHIVNIYISSFKFVLRHMFY